MSHETLTPPKLMAGDRVRLVSPASTPNKEGVEQGAEVLTSWGLRVEFGDHLFDEFGYLAGTDEDRLSDFNDALRDPGVKAIFATRGGRGAYRIVEGLDFEAARRHPKPVVGFSEITILHLALWQRCNLVGIHAPMSDSYRSDDDSVEALRRALMTTEPVIVRRDPNERTGELSTTGTATGFLMGGNLDMVATAVGAELPSLDGAILLIEDVDKGLGHTDRALTQLMNAGCLAGLRGVAVGQFIRPDQPDDSWSIIDVLRDRLTKLDVPILGGLPIGHAGNQPAVPLGTAATMNATEGTLTIASGVST